MFERFKTIVDVSMEYLTIDKFSVMINFNVLFPTSLVNDWPRYIISRLNLKKKSIYILYKN